jgi:hypothetical protein
LDLLDELLIRIAPPHKNGNSVEESVNHCSISLLNIIRIEKWYFQTYLENNVVEHKGVYELIRG